MHGSCARIHLIRLTQVENRVTFNQPTDKIDMIYNTFLYVCFLSIYVCCCCGCCCCCFFGLFGFAYMKRALCAFKALPHTLSNLLNRLTCISNTCDSIRSDIELIFCFASPTTDSIQCNLFCADVYEGILVHSVTMRPLFKHIHRRIFKLKNANCWSLKIERAKNAAEAIAYYTLLNGTINWYCWAQLWHLHRHSALLPHCKDILLIMNFFFLSHKCTELFGNIRIMWNWRCRMRVRTYVCLPACLAACNLHTLSEKALPHNRLNEQSHNF